MHAGGERGVTADELEVLRHEEDEPEETEVVRGDGPRARGEESGCLHPHVEEWTLVSNSYCANPTSEHARRAEEHQRRRRSPAPRRTLDDRNVTAPSPPASRGRDRRRPVDDAGDLDSGTTIADRHDRHQHQGPLTRKIDPYQ